MTSLISSHIHNCLKQTSPWRCVAATTAVGVGIAAIAFHIRRRYSIRRSPYVQNYEKGMVYLFQFPRIRVAPNLSPFCIKLETWLRIADIPYKNVEGLSFAFRSREGTLPMIELDGVEYPDSNLAICDLTSIFHKETLENHLNDEQKTTSRALEVMTESSLLPASIKFRMQYIKETLELFKPGTLNWLTMNLAAWGWTKVVNKKLYYNGLGRHSDENLIRLSSQDLHALSDYLGSKHYFMGFRATKIDAAVFGVLALIIYLPFDTPQRKIIEAECQNLQEFCERMKHRYWPDWDEVTQNYAMNTDWKLKAQKVVDSSVIG